MTILVTKAMNAAITKTIEMVPNPRRFAVSTESLRCARQFVVQEAFETTSISFVYLSRFTPHTNVGVS